MLHVADIQNMVEIPGAWNLQRDMVIHSLQVLPVAEDSGRLMVRGETGTCSAALSVYMTLPALR